MFSPRRKKLKQRPLRQRKRCTEELSFDIQFPEVRAKSGELFEFKANLSYAGEKKGLLNLNSEAPEGWYVSIQPSFENTEISAIKLTPNAASTSFESSSYTSG
ncbi:MAG: hypothetical protein U5N58_15385 [Actinomycetota bacterium]|nr:hypothetical protein [Actinomycetota bacterium]